MISCPLKHLQEWKDLVEAVGSPRAHGLWNEYKGDVPLEFYNKEVVKSTNILGRSYNPNEVKYALKSIDILDSDKAIKTFEKGKKNGWDLDKILTGLQVPKEQKQLILDLNTSDREDIIIELASNYSYSVEINTSTDNSISSQYIEKDGKYYRIDSEYGQEIEISKYNYDINIEPEPTRHYDNLTVPGGINYTENEIAIPTITPSIKGHAQFSTDNGIGWFRGDEKKISIQDLNIPSWESPEFKITGSKTRRILEVQSDLFQKGRDRASLTDEDVLQLESLLQEEKENNLTEDGKLELEEIKAKLINKDKKNENFLQLLNKNNNWVTFFIKSIVQDSVKKGYEKVLFSSGNTAGKIEGHVTLEGFKREKETRIKLLEKDLNVDGYDIEKDGDNTYIFKLKDYSQKSFVATSKNEAVEKFEESINNEINQLKQELERVETEGFGALRPIYNFYENTVTNILNKTYGKENVSKITDEYGNTWNEVIIDKKRDESDIFLKEEKLDFNNLVDENAKSLAGDVANDTKNIGETEHLLFDNKSGLVTVDKVLSNISNNLTETLSPEAKFLVDKAIKLQGKSKTKIRFVHESELKSETTVMQYEASSNTIMISKERLKKYSSQTAVVAFIHEVVHSQTVLALQKNAKDRTFAEQELYDVVKRFMNKYKDSSLSDEYGFTDEFEFVAEFYSNPEFRDAVKDLSDNWWRQILRAIGRLFDFTLNREYQELMNTIVDFVEGNITDNFDGIKNYDRVFEHRLVSKSKFASLEDKLSNLLSKGLDAIEAIEKRTSNALRLAKKDNTLSRVQKNKKVLERKADLQNVTDLKKELEKYAVAKKWKGVIGYVKSFGKAIVRIESLLTKLENNPNATDDEIIKAIHGFEDYLGAYDLLDDIKEIVNQAKHELGNLTPEEIKDYNEVVSFLNQFQNQHSFIKDRFISIKKVSMAKMFSSSIYNTEIETKHRNHLSKEWEALTDKQGMSKNEYISKMLSTRDKADFEADLADAAESFANDPIMDMTWMSSHLSDSINSNSRIIQIVNNIIAEYRDKLIEAFKPKDIALFEIGNKLINEKGNIKMSELNKNLIERDSNGRVYLKGLWSIKYKDSYNNELLAYKSEIRSYTNEQVEAGRKRSEVLKDDKVKELSLKVKQWVKDNQELVTEKGQRAKLMPKKSKYLNSSLIGAEKEALEAYKKVNRDNEPIYEGHGGLIEHVGGVEYDQIPSSEKTGLERRLEGDLKGHIKHKIRDYSKLNVDDVGTQGKEEAIDYKGGKIQHVRALYRGEVLPENQSLDLNTLFRREIFNGLEFKKNTELKPKLSLIIDVVGNADVNIKSQGATTKLINRFTKRNPNVAIKGEYSNVHKRLIGLMEREIYHTYSKYAGTVLGIDANKAVSAINGYAATLAMSFNFVSAGANLANGFTNLFIESFGGDVIKKNTLIKAEARYTKELMNGSLLADMTKPIKESYFNQLLEMFDVMGGLDLVEQESIRNSVDRKVASFKQLNVLNETGEHMMHSILTEAILDGIKVMNSDNKYIDKEGNVVSKEKAASLSDMLYIDPIDKTLKMSDKVKFTDFNLATEYSEGGKVHVNMLIKSKVFDIFGVYDIRFKSELAKTLIGKLVLMFKNFFVSGAEYRYTGFGSAFTKKEDLKDEELFYRSANKEYIEGTYTTFIRFMRHGVYPAIKDFKLQYIAENYNQLTDYEKANLKKASLEFALTSVILPIIGFLLKLAIGGGDDDKAWYLVLILRRLEQEMSQFRNLSEAGKMISNPVAGTRFFNNMSHVLYDVLTPVNLFPDKNESFFGYLDETSKGKNKMLKDIWKVTPVMLRHENTYKQLYGLQFGK